MPFVDPRMRTLITINSDVQKTRFRQFMLRVHWLVDYCR